MRVDASNDEISVRAYAGSTGVLLGFDIAARFRHELLGFAVLERRGGRPYRPLKTMLSWQGDPIPEPGTQFPSNAHPIQKFRWSDYTVEPGRTYQYKVVPVYGEPDTPTYGSPLELQVATEDVLDGGHRVVFNRAAAASQAFAHTFPDIDNRIREAQIKSPNKPVVLPADACDWLSRGAVETIEGFIDRAKGPGWALSIAIYEYELDRVADRVLNAIRNDANVRVLYHCKASHDRQTIQNARLVGPLGEHAKGRHPAAIFHDKFVVLSKVSPSGKFKPVAVLTGSTNWTDSGVYRQANVVHVVNDPGVATTYQELFEVIWEHPGTDEPAVADHPPARTWISANSCLDFTDEFNVGFSPRSPVGGRHSDLDAFARMIRSAGSDLIFATAFDLDPVIKQALIRGASSNVLKLGIENQKSSITGWSKNREFTATGLLETGIEGFLKESWQKGSSSIHVHLKAIVIDFATANPTVISGSHNLSASASKSNDENYFVIRGRTDLADVYGVELLRIYDHYRFRSRMFPPRSKRDKKGKHKPADAIPHLTRDGSWTDRYFNRTDMAYVDRLTFAGPNRRTKRHRSR